jgi:hypothetical protein
VKYGRSGWFRRCANVQFKGQSSRVKYAVGFRSRPGVVKCRGGRGSVGLVGMLKMVCRRCGRVVFGWSVSAFGGCGSIAGSG